MDSYRTIWTIHSVVSKIVVPRTFAQTRHGPVTKVGAYMKSCTLFRRCGFLVVFVGSFVGCLFVCLVGWFLLVGLWCLW